MARILVVDDEPVNRELITTLLGYAGHESIEAADGVEALSQVRAERPDLVICDILMPTMDGYEFVRQLRGDAQIAHTEVIFYTATFMEREARQLARSCGVLHVLVKPCEPEEILRTVQRALGREAAPEQVISTEDFDREHLRLLTDKLVEKVDELERANQRLSALTELNLQLASEHDPRALLEKVCRGARDLIGAKCAVLAVKDKTGDGAVHVATWGLGIVEAARLSDQPIDAGMPGRAMRQRSAHRFVNEGGDPLAVGLSAAYPEVHCGLIAPIISLQNAYGWIFLIDKLGESSFSEEDERLLAIHAAQAGRIYENGSLYAAMKRAAEQLRIEVVERERVAAALRVANELLEQRVAARTAELRETIEGLESFNRIVSHDLRGPLGGIAGGARLARDYMVEGDSAKADHMLQLIAARATTTEQLVGALLALARASDATLKTEPVDMNRLVQEVIESLPFAGPATPVAVVSVLPQMDVDPVLVRQVFLNLIGNALKFANSGTPLRVEVGADTGADGTVFFVRDNGVGFDADPTQRLFKPFQRLHGNQFEGFGIGLSIVRRIVERHGGKVWAESERGRGATFYFTFGSRSPRSV
ncbi:ATP-binding protein [Methylibium sp.]|uniref:ATP-binding protein n=1 Tax=Methylibium sp. TaxID=2067992 RepID=UPI003D0CD3C0